MNKWDIVDNFANNIEIERKRMRLSQEEMASRLDLSVSGYRKIINKNVDTISYWTLYKAHQLTGLFGFQLCGLKGSSSEILEKLKGLSEYQKTFIQSVIDFELEFSEKKAAGASTYLSVLVPTGNLEDGMLWDSCSIEKVEASQYFRKYGTRLSCGIKVTSNHLHPAYNKGDILLICRSAPRDGDTGIFLNKETGCAYLRRFVQGDVCRLEPVNGFGEIYFVDSASKASMDKWLKFGFVLSKMR